MFVVMGRISSLFFKLPNFLNFPNFIWYFTMCVNSHTHYTFRKNIHFAELSTKVQSLACVIIINCSIFSISLHVVSCNAIENIAYRSVARNALFEVLIFMVL
jgi:hypothetical protein